MTITFIWPLDSHSISRDFYYLGSIYIGGQHGAIDIPASIGTPIKVAAAGLVTKATYNDISGHYIEVAHNEGWVTNYRHLVEQASVSVGASVSQGQIIGKVGSTGWSTGPHLHFDLWNSIKQSPEAMYKGNIWAHDPELYLGKEEEMTDEEFLTQLNRVLSRAKVVATLADGKTKQSRFHTLGWWIDLLRRHHEDKTKHGSGGDSYTDAKAVKAVKDKLSN